MEVDFITRNSWRFRLTEMGRGVNKLVEINLTGNLLNGLLHFFLHLQKYT